MKILKWFTGLIVLAVLAFIVWPSKAYQPTQLSPEFEKLAAAYPVPAMPDDWQWHKYTAPDGLALRWGMTAKPAETKATLLIIPGFTGTLELYAEHIEHWQSQNYHVVGLDPRGQGGSARMLKNPETPWVKDFSKYSEDLSAFVLQELSEVPSPLIVVGTSMGSHIGFRTALDYDTAIDGIVLIAPAFRPRTDPYAYGTAKRIVNIASLLNKSKHYAVGQKNWQPWSEDFTRPSACSGDLNRINRYDALFAVQPEFRVGGASNGWLSAFMRSGEYISQPENYNKLTIPIHMLHSGNDTIVVPEAAQTVCADMKLCTQQTVADAGHCLQMERDDVQAQIYRAVDDMVAMLTK